MNFELLSHHYQRELQLLWLRFARSQGTDFALGIGILVFSAVFLIVGVVRSIEFQDKGFSTFKRRVLIALHVIGTILVSVAMALFALDIGARHTSEIGLLIGAAFLILMPIHIYLALVRRIRLGDAQSKL